MAGILSATTTAQQLGAAACRSVLIQNDPDNTAYALIGDKIAQPIKLSPGQTIELPVDNVSEVYAKMASGTGTIGWLDIG